MTTKEKVIKKQASKKDVEKIIAKNHPSKQEVKSATRKIMAQYKTAIKNLASR